jgi:hypothetical protein
MKVLEPAGGKNARVWLDGEEVTEVCFRANAPDSPGSEESGHAWLYKDGGAAERVDGMVRWQPPDIVIGLKAAVVTGRTTRPSE